MEEKPASTKCTSQYPEYRARSHLLIIALSYRFMALDPYQMGYFIQQVGLSATSFGVTAADAMAAGMALNKLFNYRCSPPTTVVKAQGPQLQSMCTDPSCPLDPMAMCGLEDNNGTVMMPKNLTMNSTTMMNGSTMAPATPKSTGDAAKMGVASLVVFGAAVFALLM